ncbi:MAG: EamA family transporter [Acidimicrobiia bacterium]|nr:EamA family transporter [Acidimicrobiia bacterium]
MVILFASVAAFLFAAGSVTAKRGMQNTNAVSALLVSSGVAAVLLAAATAFSIPDSVTFRSVLFFVAAGLVGDGIGRFTMLGAVDRLGPSIAIPIQTAAYPLVAVLGGIIVLSESVNAVQVVGAVTVVAGVWVLLFDRPAAPSGASNPAVQAPPRAAWVVLALPAIAGIAFAASDLLRKTGLDETPNPAFGALVAVAGMLTLISVGALVVPRMRERIHVGQGWSWLVVAGVCFAGGLLAVFEALETGAVSAIGPIIAAQPLAVVALSWMLLHNIERITLRMVIGAVLVVGGVIAIAVAS